MTFIFFAFYFCFLLYIHLFLYTLLPSVALYIKQKNPMGTNIIQAFPKLPLCLLDSVLVINHDKMVNVRIP